MKLAGLARMEGTKPIVNGTKTAGKCGGTIQIRAQGLREEQALMQAGTKSGFTLIDDDLAKRLEHDQPPRDTQWLETDVKRAIAAAQEAGLESFRVEIGPDGTITIILDGAAGEGQRDDPYQGLTKV